jgi:hypothetical protein
VTELPRRSVPTPSPLPPRPSHSRTLRDKSSVRVRRDERQGKAVAPASPSLSRPSGPGCPGAEGAAESSVCVLSASSLSGFCSCGSGVGCGVRAASHRAHQLHALDRRTMPDRHDMGMEPQAPARHQGQHQPAHKPAQAR